MLKRKYFPIYLFAIGLTLLSILAVVTPARALEFKSGGDILIPQGEVVADDLYVGAENFTLEGTIKGDLVVFASVVHITPGGVVEGDLLAGAQTIIIEGEVQDDARVGGAAIVLGSDAVIADDLITSGYSLETMTGSQVGGDVLFAGFQAKLSGDIEGSLVVFANGLDLQGSVGGDVTAELGSAEDIPPFLPFGFIPNMPPIPSVSGGLTVGSGAQIGGDLEYTSEQRFEIPGGIVTGEETRIEPAPSPEEELEEQVTPSSVNIWFIQNLRNLLALLVLGLLMAWLTPRFLENSAQALRSKPWHSLGLGLLSFAVIFFAVLILGAVTVLLTLILGLITLGELVWVTIIAGILVISILVFVFIISVMYLSKLVASFLVGRLILERIKPEWAESRYWPMVLGVILFAILVSIPYVGWLIGTLAMLFGLGALFLLEIDWIRGMWSRQVDEE
jgi:cytoskeletal protein CcmA (bactofilin family)